MRAQSQNEVVTREYENGGVYEGTFKDGKQDGHGTYRLPNGYEYTGDWVDGEIRGQGESHFSNGSTDSSSFIADKPELWNEDIGE